MKEPKKNSSEIDDRSDPLDEELDITKLERVKLESPDNEFDRATDYVLTKIEELYRRLVS
jgi:hypothetical protein